MVDNLYHASDVALLLYFSAFVNITDMLCWSPLFTLHSYPFPSVYLHKSTHLKLNKKIHKINSKILFNNKLLYKLFW